MKSLYIILFLFAVTFTSIDVQGQTYPTSDYVVQGQPVIQGQRIPTLTTDQRNQIVISHSLHGVIIYNTDTQCQEYWDGTKWVSLCGYEWFYMPSFNLDIATVGTGQIFDLYEEYKKQFTKSGNNQFVSSNPAVTAATPVYAADKLDYIVTAYPTTVLKINSISAAGVMNYDVISTNIPEGCFINVIFAVK